MSQKSTFFNQKLLKAYQEIEPTLKERKLFLDNLSEDIKSLERKLSEVVCPLGISLEYHKDYRCDVLKSISSANFDEYFNRVSCGTLIETCYSILWDKASTGTPRLLHMITRNHFNVYFKNGGHPAIDVWREKETTESDPSRPLIECSAEIRIKTADYLPKLLTFVGDKLSTSNIKESLNSADLDDCSWAKFWKEEACNWHTLPEEAVLPF